MNRRSEWEDGKITTTDKTIPETFSQPTPSARQKKDGQFESYWVLSESERKKGFVRPVRYDYVHVGIEGPKHPLRELNEKEIENGLNDHFVKFEAYPVGSPEHYENGSSLVGKYWTQEQLNKIGKGCGVGTVMGQALSETYARNPRFYGSTFCVGCGTHLPVGKDGEFVWDGTNERVGT